MKPPSPPCHHAEECTAQCRPLTFSSQPHSPRLPLLTCRGGDTYTRYPLYTSGSHDTCSPVTGAGSAWAVGVVAARAKTASPAVAATPHLLIGCGAVSSGRWLGSAGTTLRRRTRCRITAERINAAPEMTNTMGGFLLDTSPRGEFNRSYSDG